MSKTIQLRLHPKQSKVFQSPARQLLFGGSAGPGKSHLLRVAGCAWASAIPGLQVYLFRRTFPDLYKNHMEGPSSLPVLLGDMVSSRAVKIDYTHHRFSFCNGSRIHLMHMQYEKDVSKIQGAEIHVALIDELTHFSKKQYAYIRSRVRMAGIDVPEPFAGAFPRILAASNPGGVGHNWVKKLFVDPAPRETIWQAPKDEGGLLTQFIPALLRDNPTLLEEDPEYADRLSGLGNDALVKAMLDGSWDIVEGGFFDDIWDESIHAIPPFEIPAEWTVRRAFDWGSSKPFSVGWWAHADGSTPVGPERRVYPKNTRFLVGEWYGWNGKPNEGLKLTNKQISDGIKERESRAPWGKKVRAGPADPSIYAVIDGKSIGGDMASYGTPFIPAQTGAGSRKNGWQMLRQSLQAGTEWPMQSPGLFVFNTCRQFIRTVPVLPRDEDYPDDVDTNAEDHCGDMCRYELSTMSATGRVARIGGL